MFLSDLSIYRKYLQHNNNILGTIRNKEIEFLEKYNTKTIVNKCFQVDELNKIK